MTTTAVEAPRGRDLYARLRPLLTIIEKLVERVPAPLARRMLVAFRGSSGLLGRALRFALLRKLASRCGELVDIREDVHLRAVHGLSIGDRVSIHPLSYIDATGGVVIGNDTSIAHGVTIMSTSHRFDDCNVPIRDQGVEARPVVVHDDVWVGAGARILGGTTIGGGSVVAAGAVVTQDVPAGVVVAGVPARIVRSRKG